MRRRFTAAVFAVSLPLLAACGGGDSPASDSSPSSTAEFKEKDLKTAVAAAQEYNDRYTSGDYEGAYDLTAQETQDAYSFEEFEKIQQACYQGGGMPVDVEGVRVSGDKATVRLVLGDFKVSRQVVHEDGGWRMTVDNDTDLSLSADEAAVECEKESAGDE